VVFDVAAFVGDAVAVVEVFDELALFLDLLPFLVGRRN
jgi:hypothetical protein